MPGRNALLTPRARSTRCTRSRSAACPRHSSSGVTTTRSRRYAGTALLPFFVGPRAEVSSFAALLIRRPPRFLRVFRAPAAPAGSCGIAPTTATRGPVRVLRNKAASSRPPPRLLVGARALLGASPRATGEERWPSRAHRAYSKAAAAASTVRSARNRRTPACARRRPPRHRGLVRLFGKFGEGRRALLAPPRSASDRRCGAARTPGLHRWHRAPTSARPAASAHGAYVSWEIFGDCATNPRDARKAGSALSASL